MWLITLSFAAAIVTALWYIKDVEGKYKLGFLSSILWGATILSLVDHVIGYLTEGGEFFEVSLDAFLLSVVLLTVALVIWEVVLIVKDPLGRLRKSKRVRR